jgi:hypothetical protein
VYSVFGTQPHVWAGTHRIPHARLTHDTPMPSMSLWVERWAGGWPYPHRGCVVCTRRRGHTGCAGAAVLVRPCGAGLSTYNSVGKHTLAPLTHARAPSATPSMCTKAGWVPYRCGVRFWVPQLAMSTAAKRSATNHGRQQQVWTGFVALLTTPHTRHRHTLPGAHGCVHACLARWCPHIGRARAVCVRVPSVTTRLHTLVNRSQKEYMPCVFLCLSDFAAYVFRFFSHHHDDVWHGVGRRVVPDSATFPTRPRPM